DAQDVQQQAADHRVGQAAFLAVSGDLGEQLRLQRGNALAQGFPEDPGEEEQADAGGGHAEHHRDDVLDAALGIERGGHQLPSFVARRRSMRRAISSTMKVTTKSRKAMAISAERCRPWASPNWLAMVEAMELPVSRNDRENLKVLPSTKA